jgi:hypothetical protein
MIYFLNFHFIYSFNSIQEQKEEEMQLKIVREKEKEKEQLEIKDIIPKFREYQKSLKNKVDIAESRNSIKILEQFYINKKNRKENRIRRSTLFRSSVFK